MAWLESLAAKQGAAEDELLTPPEERLEEPPEWVQEAALEDEVLEEAEAEDDKVETVAAAALASVAAGVLSSEEEEDDEQAAVPAADLSEWVPEITEEPEITGKPAVEEVLPLEDVEPEFVEVTAEVLEADPEVVPLIGEGEDELEVDEAFPSPTEEVLVQEEELEQPPEDIPEWLSDLTEEQAEVEVPAEWTPTMLIEKEIEPDIIEVPSDVKIDLNAASLAQLEKFPGIGFIHAQRIVNYRAESGPFKELDDLQKVPGLTLEMVEDLHAYLTVEVVTEAAPPISTHPELQEAWNSVNGGEIDAAVDQYAQLINRDEHLDEIIRDLQEALGRYPQDAALYQSLGDAYLHANMLQEALDAYNRAEDLII
jgi:competence ComEA-like helix-hairpin-helix protein